MDINQSFKLALKSMKASKMRSFLTMLGIIIGVASVIILVSIVDGFSSTLTSSFESMGTNLITVSIRGRGSSRSVSEDELRQLVYDNEEVLSSLSPKISVGNATVKYGTTSISASTTGVSEEYFNIEGLKITSGRLLTYMDIETRKRVCVVGTYVIKELFGASSLALNQIIKINGEEFKIVGILEEKNGGEEGTEDASIYLPYTSSRVIGGSSNANSYVIAATDKNLAEKGVSIIEAFLYEKFQNENAYSVIAMSEMLDTINELTGTLTLVLVGIAGISLLVGGIGIMNIMLVSVTERTREIGIRKSLGAKRRDIMTQFVIEAATTSAVGGIIGIIFGGACAVLCGKLMEMTVIPSLAAVIVAFSVSVAIGMIFGYFPASKAAKLNPIEALRYD